MIAAVKRDPEAGNAALELVILAPALLLLIGLVIALGRTTSAQNAVADAARDAARQASLQINPASALAAGQQSALAALAQDGLNCTPIVHVYVDGYHGVPAFQARVGQPASVSATVTCVVSLASITLPGLPGSKTLSMTFTSPLDPYRER
jgi:Flp pilus assembly protein TadG